MISKIPQPAAFKNNKLYSKKSQFSHIVSPIGRYIKNTPSIPLAKTVKLNYYDGFISKIYNSRDSDVSFKENYDDTNSADTHVALPLRSKIGTIKKQVLVSMNNLCIIKYFHKTKYFRFTITEIKRKLQLVLVVKQ